MFIRSVIIIMEVYSSVSVEYTILGVLSFHSDSTIAQNSAARVNNPLPNFAFVFKGKG